MLAPGGVAVIVTPNRLTFGRPDEIIDPYHYVELDAEQLRALCAPHFASVELRGLFGSDRYLALVAAERARLDALLRRDPLRLRRLVPRRARQALYDRLLARARTRRTRAPRPSRRTTSTWPATRSMRVWISWQSAAREALRDHRTPARLRAAGGASAGGRRVGRGRRRAHGRPRLRRPPRGRGRAQLTASASPLAALDRA